MFRKATASLKLIHWGVTKHLSNNLAFLELGENLGAIVRPRSGWVWTFVFLPQQKFAK